MATRTVRVHECDFCGSTHGVVQRKIAYLDEGVTRTVDLCVDHLNAGVADIAELLPRGKRNVPRGQAVVSPAEVKRARRTGTKKAAAKKTAASTRKRS